MRLVRGETDPARRRLRTRFLELVEELRPEVLQELLGLQSLYQRDWPRPIVTPIHAHSVWTQVVEVPSWLDTWLRRYKLKGSTDQWVEKTALFTLKHYLGPGRETPSDRRRFVVPRLTPLPVEDHEVAAAPRYEPRPFRYEFPPIDQTLEDWDDVVKGAINAAANAWRLQLQEERLRAQQAGYTWDESRERRADLRLRRLVEFQVLERGYAEIARPDQNQAHSDKTQRRTSDAQLRTLERQANADKAAQSVRRDVVSMARLIGLPLRDRD